MKIVHLYTGDDGESHFRDIELPMTTMMKALAYEFPGVEGVQFRAIPKGLTLGFHTASRRQLIVQLKGSGEIDCGNGEVRRFGATDYLLADDRTGRGHISREISGPREQLLVYISEAIQIDQSGLGPASPVLRGDSL